MPLTVYPTNISVKKLSSLKHQIMSLEMPRMQDFTPFTPELLGALSRPLAAWTPHSARCGSRFATSLTPPRLHLGLTSLYHDTLCEKTLVEHSGQLNFIYRVPRITVSIMTHDGKLNCLS